MLLLWYPVSVPSSRRLPSHYVPVSFVILCGDIRMHMPSYIYSRYSFFSLYPLIVPPTVLLWIWYFLIPIRSRALSLPLSLLRFVLYTSLFLLFRRISFRCLSHHYLSHNSLPHLFFTPLTPSLLFCVNLILIFPFFFPRSTLWSSSLPFSLLLYCTSCLHAPFPIMIFSSAFSTLSSHTVFIVPSRLPQSSRYTPQLARRDGFSFPACHTCIRRA